MTNTKEFEILLLRKGISKKFIAELLGKSLQTVYNKIHNVVDFTATEIMLICNSLQLSKDERDLIFFAEDVDK